MQEPEQQRQQRPDGGEVADDPVGEVQDAVRRRERQEERIDETIDQSFPASDPPSSTPVQGVGAPPDTPRESELEDDPHEGRG